MILKINLTPFVLEKQMKLGRTITSREIAKSTGLSETRISIYRQGNIKMIKLENLQKLAAYFGCLAGELLDDGRNKNNI